MKKISQKKILNIIQRKPTSDDKCSMILIHLNECLKKRTPEQSIQDFRKIGFHYSDEEFKNLFSYLIDKKFVRVKNKKKYIITKEGSDYILGNGNYTKWKMFCNNNIEKAEYVASVAGKFFKSAFLDNE